MTVLKQYNTGTSTWETIVVGQPGAPGMVTSSTAPANTSVLWMDTADANSQVAVPAGGTAGQVLAKTTGVDYATGWIDNTDNRNAIINGGFDIWQRGTSHTPTSYAYTADRWMGFRASFASGLTISRQTSGLAGTQYCARVQRNSGNTGTQDVNFYYALESAQSTPFAGQTVTLSFYARAGADLSDTTLDYNLRSGTGADQAPQSISSWTGGSSLGAGTATLTTSWQRITLTASVASTATQLGFTIINNPTGTAGAADYFEITGVQLEAGSIATPFKRNAPSLQAELAACQRYYWRATAATAFSLFGQGQASSTTVQRALIDLPVILRTAPTSVDYGSIEISDFVSGYSSGTFTLDTNFSTSKIGCVAYTHGSGALTQYREYVTKATASTAFVGFSAEL